MAPIMMAMPPADRTYVGRENMDIGFISLIYSSWFASQLRKFDPSKISSYTVVASCCNYDLAQPVVLDLSEERYQFHTTFKLKEVDAGLSSDLRF